MLNSCRRCWQSDQRSVSDPILLHFPSGDKVPLSGITEQGAAVGRTRIDNGDKEKFHAANEFSFQIYQDMSLLLEA